MRITEVETIHCRAPAADVAPGTADEALVVRIHTDEGLTGIGEVYGRSLREARAAIEGPGTGEGRPVLADLLQGEDPRASQRLWEAIVGCRDDAPDGDAFARAAGGVEIALWDLKGKIEGKPVYELFGGMQRKTVRAFGNLTFGETVEETEAAVRRILECDLTAAQLSGGPFGRDAEDDLLHVRAAREALGEHRDLIVGPGRDWDSTTAQARAELIEPYDILWLDEPLPESDVDGYRALCLRSPVPVGAGRDAVGLGAFEQLIEAGVHVVRPDPARCGGLTVCREVSALCDRAGRRCVPRCGGTVVGLAAALHWLASQRHGDLIEYGLDRGPLLRDLPGNPPSLADGRLAVPRGPGLGVELVEAVLQRYRVADDEPSS